MSLRRTRLRSSLRISSFGNQVELLHQGQVVLDVPVVGDAPVGDAVDVGADEIDRLALALGLLEAPGEVATKVQVHDDAITGHDHLFDLASDIGDRRMHQLGGRQWSGEPLRAPSRQGDPADRPRRRATSITLGNYQSLSPGAGQLLRSARSPAAALPGAEHARADSPQPSPRLRAALQGARGRLELDRRSVGGPGEGGGQMTLVTAYASRPRPLERDPDV